MKQIPRRVEWAALLVVVMAAAFLRLYRLDEVPPGWRDDELINSLVISQHVLDGELAFFYPDASGHEALYHVLNAGMLALFGPGVAGIRWLSVLLGVLSVWLTYLVGRELFGWATGLVAALGLASSFWSLMYSRVGLRHVSLLPLMLGAFLLLWRGTGKAAVPSAGDSGLGRRWIRPAVAAGFLLGVSFYTYFAARGLPLIVLALLGYWLLLDRPRLRRTWRGAALALTIGAGLAVPLVLSLPREPEVTGRVEELAVPLVEARQGDWQPLMHHIATTLSMFHATGDGEWLYNLPDRPVFNLTGALSLLLGLVVSLYRALPWAKSPHRDQSAFLLFWFVAGLAPAFVSVPPASLGHTIIAQPAAYLLPAAGLTATGQWARSRWQRLGRAVAPGMALLFLVSNGARDLGDYFNVWPQRGMVRFLYRADIHEAAGYLNSRPDIQDVAFSSPLAGPWDEQALLVDLERPLAHRWFDPSRAILYPAGGGYIILTAVPELAPELEPTFHGTAELVAEQGTVQVYEVAEPCLVDNRLPGGREVRFGNGLTLVRVVPMTDGVLTEWRAETPALGLPARRLISNPPPPGVETRPRLLVFAHLLDWDGRLVAGDDGLWVDPHTLRPGDTLLQLHRFSEPIGDYELEIGLYDPVTGERVGRDGGQDRVALRLDEG
jgi:4-amino-4-deoxy-L-arabinose transferase-like glycosyltransferase